jgi:hypothetical protein
MDSQPESEIEMANEFEKVVEDIGKGIEYPFKFADKAAKVLATIIKDDPEAKIIFTTLTQKCEAIGADVLMDVGAKGLNLIADEGTITALQDLGAYLKGTVIPFIEAAYGTIVADVVTTAATTDAPATGS